jgi:hypothetical protein
MADIIEFGKKAQDFRSEQDSAERRRKIESLRKIFQCTRCMLKCAKCGTQLDMHDSAQSRYANPYPFCGNCKEEYEEYRVRTEDGKSQRKYYWYNDTWMQVWESWLKHQECLDSYRQSKEFLQLLQEVEEFLGK